MLEVNDTNFKEEITKRNLVLVDFYATWCGPCAMQAKVLEKMQNSRGIDFDIVKVNVDEAPRLATEYGIDSIPTLMIFKDNKLQKKIIGYTEEDELLNIIEEYK